MPIIQMQDVLDAYAFIKPLIRPTSLDLSSNLSKRVGRQVFLKHENEQLTGSFKIRGALNKLRSLNVSEKKAGVVACSAGNHAQGVAFGASTMGITSHIVMPNSAPIIKVEATKGYGAKVYLHGEIFDETLQRAHELEKEHGYIFVHPYEDPKIVAGQATIGLELSQHAMDWDSIIVPVGGGGLISGISFVLKQMFPKIKIIGVQSDQAPGMTQKFQGEHVEPKKKSATIADGIAVKSTSPWIFENFISKYVDEMVTVTDDEISDAMVFLLERSKTVTEGSGAAGVAALFHRKLDIGEKTCVVLSGGNIDLNTVSKVIEKGLLHKGRLAALSVVVDDLPGNLNRLTKTIADLRANVMEVHHDRIAQGLSLRETKIDFVLETRSFDHIQEIRAAIAALGGKLI
jgi:threonine dehydratase